MERCFECYQAGDILTMVDGHYVCGYCHDLNEEGDHTHLYGYDKIELESRGLLNKEE